MWTALIATTLLATPLPPADDANAALQGAWAAESLEADGRAAPPEAVSKMRFTFQGDKILVRGNFRDDREEEGSYTIDASKSPKQIDLKLPNAPKAAAGIYEVKGDELKICLRHSSSDEGRPTEFATKPGTRLVLMVFKKQPK